jgi:hypothetical protein
VRAALWLALWGAALLWPTLAAPHNPSTPPHPPPPPPPTGDDEAKRRGVQKSIQERAAPATFDVAVEMLERGRWHVHPDVGAAVDAMLAGQHPGGQARERAPDGTILRYNYNPAIPGGTTGARGGGAGGARGGAAGAGARSALPELPRGGGAGGGGGAALASGSMDEGLARPAMPGGGGSSSFVRRGLYAPTASRDEGTVPGERPRRACEGGGRGVPSLAPAEQVPCALSCTPRAGLNPPPPRPPLAPPRPRQAPW